MHPRYICLFLCLQLVASCKSDYEKMVECELSSGVRHDSLFMGYYFGMTRSDFFKHCFQLNAQGLVTNGPENQSVLYTFQQYRGPIDMNFYPDFDNGRIYKMRIVFNYQSWAPWNKDYFADKLVPDVLDILGRWYGRDFLALKSPENNPFWVKINGNRQVLVTIQNERNIRVEITDLTVKPTPDKPVQNQDENRPVWENPTN